MGQETKINEYEIAGRKFVLRDLTLDEADEVNKLLGLSSTTKSQVELALTRDQSNRLLSLIIEPADGQKVEESFYGKCKESVSVEILKDFFLKRIMMRQSSQNFFASLMQRPN